MRDKCCEETKRPSPRDCDKESGPSGPCDSMMPCREKTAQELIRERITKLHYEIASLEGLHDSLPAVLPYHANAVLCEMIRKS